MARLRAGHARPLRTAVNRRAREGQGRAAAHPFQVGGWLTGNGRPRKARRDPSGLASSASSSLCGAPFARALPARTPPHAVGRWPSEARSDEGEVCAVSRNRDIAGNAARISPLCGQLSPMGKPFSVISIPRSAEQRSSLSASGRREGSSGQCSSRSARPHGPCSCS